MSFWNKTYSSFIRIKSGYALNKETKINHGNIMILQTFTLAVRQMEDLVCFELNPHHNFVT